MNKVGRPEKNPYLKKSIHRSIRFDRETYDKLRYLVGVDEKSESNIVRKAVEELYLKRVHE